jgi:hypothetical protein
MERVTDDQFSLLDGKIRHVPGGVEEYLRLLDARSDARAEARADKPRSVESPAPPLSDESDEQGTPALSWAEERVAKKELASTERKLDTLGKKADGIRAEMRAADPSDYVALQEIQARLHGTERQISELEDTWVELSTRLPG